MAEISKPDYTYIWSSGGANVAPSNVKIQTGWTAEVPPFQWENWSQNRQDQAIAHVLQHGISVWDNSTEYQANKSYVQGSDGVVYRALTTHTNVNPVGTTGSWQVAFATVANIPVKANTSQSQAWTDDTAFLTPLKLLQSFQGSNQNLATTGYQKFPGGCIVQWGRGTSSSSGTVTATFPLAFPNSCNVVVGSAVNSSIQSDAFELSATPTTLSFGYSVVSSGPGGASVQVATPVFWIAIGY